MSNVLYTERDCVVTLYICAGEANTEAIDELRGAVQLASLVRLRLVASLGRQTPAGGEELPGAASGTAVACVLSCDRSMHSVRSYAFS